MIETGLFQLATGNTAISDFLGEPTAVYFSVLPKQPTLPALVISRISLIDPAVNLDLPTVVDGLMEGRFQFSCFAKDNTDSALVSPSGFLCAAALSRALRSQLQSMVGAALPDGTVLNDVYLNNEIDTDFETGGTGYIFRRLLDMTLWFQEGGEAPEEPVPFQRYYPNQSPNGSRTVFTFTGEAASHTQFELFWNGMLQNEGSDYAISIGGGLTTVTMTDAPQTGQPLIAYF